MMTPEAELSKCGINIFSVVKYIFNTTSARSMQSKQQKKQQNYTKKQGHNHG